MPAAAICVRRRRSYPGRRSSRRPAARSHARAPPRPARVPEAAATSIAPALHLDELPGQHEGVAEIEAQRLAAFDMRRNNPNSVLYFISPIASASDAERVAPAPISAPLASSPATPGRRHRVDVGDDEQARRPPRHAAARRSPRRRGRRTALTSACSQRRLLVHGAGVGGPTSTPNRRLISLAASRTRRPPVMPGKVTVRAFERRDHAGGEAHHAGGAEYDQSSVPASSRAIRVLRSLSDVRDHRRGRGERARGIGEQRNHERRHHRLPGALEHVERGDGSPCRR